MASRIDAHEEAHIPVQQITEGEPCSQERRAAVRSAASDAEHAFAQADGGSANASRPPAASPRWSTKQLVVMALFCALAALLSFLELPIFPAAPFLKYDASFVPVMVGGFAYGAGPGVAIGIVAAAIHGLLMGDLPGAVMNMLATVGYVLPAALIYKRVHTRKGAVIGLVAGSVASIACAILGNLVITPLYMGVPLSSVVLMILPILLPFNALKAVINSILTMLVYKSISNLITPVKDQVKGK